MLNNSRTEMVLLVDIESTSNERFEKFKKVANGRKFALHVDFAGMQTMQLGQAQGIILSYSIEIPRILYNGEKYCYFDNQVYEVETLSKAKLATNMLLNVSKLEDEEITKAIETWLEENSDIRKPSD